MKENEMEWACGKKGNSYRVLVGKHEGKRLLRINRHSWEDSITADIKSDGRKWTGLIWLRIGKRGRFLWTW